MQKARTRSFSPETRLGLVEVLICGLGITIEECIFIACRVYNTEFISKQKQISFNELHTPWSFKAEPEQLPSLSFILVV